MLGGLQPASVAYLHNIQVASLSSNVQRHTLQAQQEQQQMLIEGVWCVWCKLLVLSLP